MNRMGRLALLLALLGCAQPDIDMSLVVDPPPGADVAEQVILAKYGVTAANVYWYGPQANRCPDHASFHSPETGKCVREVYWPRSNEMVVSLVFMGQPVADTELVHGYAHKAIGVEGLRKLAAREVVLNIGVDGGHLRRDWWGDYNVGKPGGIVEDTRAMIQDALCTFVEAEHATVCVAP